MNEWKNAVISKLIAKTKDKQLKDFIAKLYYDLPEYELETVNIEHLLKATLSTYKTFKTYKNNEPKVNIFIDNKESDIAVVEVLCSDMPFLLDSLTNELKQLHCEIHLIVHSSLIVKRDKNGHFQNFHLEGNKEMLMQFHISNLYDEAWYDKLKTRISDILTAISFAVQDWRSMIGRMEKDIESIKAEPSLKHYKLRDESAAFLEWLVNNHMVFLGAIEYKAAGKKLLPVDTSRLGVARSNLHNIGQLPFDDYYHQMEPLLIRKWDERSVVHRTSHMDWIIIKKFDAKGKCIGASMFFGLFTSTVYYQSVRNIPLMRKKIESIIQRYGYPETSHNCKELITALESFPRGELLKMSIDELYETSTAIVSLSLIPRVKVFFRKDQAGNFVSCIVFIPEKRFSAETKDVVEGIICKYLHGSVSKRYVQVSDSGLVRMQLLLITESKNIKDFDTTLLEHNIIKAISVWSDELFTALHNKLLKKEALVMYTKYKDAFDVKYKSIFPGAKAVHDIKLIEEALELNKVRFDIYISKAATDGEELTQLKIYSPHRELALSSTLPVVENMGLFAQDVFTYKVQINNGMHHEVYIHHFRLQTPMKAASGSEDMRQNMQTAFERVWAQDMEDDKYNSLIIAANISWREVILIRAIAKYLKQTDFPYSFEFTLETLLQHAGIVKKFVDYFTLKFAVNRKPDLKAVELLAGHLKTYIRSVKTVAEDRILNGFLNVLKAMKRTNFYQNNDKGEYKNYLSFKLASKEIPDLPKPKPYAEIFVYSSHFEAIHLRGGKVARGGLRWSDRKEDFRTEVLGLMKAQMTKNSVIVPVGSKGGFVLKKVSPNDGREEYMKEGIECYKTFLSGLLDITDNIVHNKVSPPKQVVRYDENDPYLVVAADKGTATFSDFANAVSAQYKFWLDDAFASGGSAGYDHKKMGITAKGGWISVKRHFEEMGVDIETQPFTCIGIGDMAGDVFGNGMILSDKIKLIAAFNHMHIFIDPNPDTQISYKERLRLFNKPRSQWSDYNTKLISKGGGIFDRKAKTIQISPEAKVALGIEENEMSPDQFIRQILLAPVDLLWNGGIGTYVKSALESNDKIGDKANDALRVDGKELRCKIIGEGGNLGMTQLGRIEYARKGGRLNTDFIDNSAGVDCSDHEVNLKIATADMLIEGKLKRKNRDALLTHMTDEVSKLVLMDNYKQTQILTLETQGRHNHTNSHAWLIKYLEAKGDLDRKIEYLPAQEDLIKIMAEQKRLTRPEVAVLLAYAKNSAFNMLMKHDLTKDELLNKFLFSYFPIEFQKKYPNLIATHKLKNEILGTVLVNDFINKLGCSYFHQLIEDLGVNPDDIIKAYVIVKEVYNIDEYWRKVEALSPQVPLAFKLDLFNEIQQLLERNILWLLNQVEMKNIDNLSSVLSTGFLALKKKIKEIATHAMWEESKQNLAMYATSKDAYNCAQEIFALKMLAPAFDIVLIAKESKAEVVSVAKVFFQIGEKLSLIWLFSQAKGFVARQHFQTVALRSLISEMFDIHRQITINEIALKKHKKSVLEKCQGDKMIQYNNFIQDLKTGDTTDAFISKMTIAVKKVAAFLNC
jgi:glutamate dehydrogenase